MDINSRSTEELEDRVNAEVVSGSEGISMAVDLYPPSTIRKNFSWILVGDIITEISLAGVLVALAKLGSAQLQGRFLLCLGIVYPVAVLFSSGLRALFISDSKEQFNFSDYFYLRLITGGLSWVLCVFIGLWLVLRGDYNWVFFVTLFFVGGFKSVEFISDMCYGAVQKKRRMKYIGISRGIRAFLALSVTVVLLFLTGNLAATMAGWLFVYCAMAFFYDMKVAGQFYPVVGNFDASRSLQIAKQAIPLVVAATFLTLNANINRYIIAGYLGEAEVGYFGTVNYAVVAISMVFIAIGNALLPEMVESFSNRPLRIWRLIFKASIVVAGLSITTFVMSLLFGRLALRVFFSAAHAKYVEVLWILTAGNILVGLVSLMGFAGTACRAFIPSSFVWGCVTFCTLISGIILVRRYGVTGAAYASIVSNFIAFLLMGTVVSIYTWRRYRQIALVGSQE